MVTIKDVAKRAGVSPATVSRVLNGKGWVSEEKRRLVNEWIVKLGYQPNQVAQSLISKRSYMIGVIITDVSNPFFGEIVRSVQMEAFKIGLSIVLYNTDTDAELERRQVDSVLRRQIDGIMIVPCKKESVTMRIISRAKIPTVVITQEHDKFDSISIDHLKAGADVAAHLISNGYSKIVYIGAKTDKKYIGFYNQAIQMGLANEDIDVIEVCYSSQDLSSIYDQVKKQFLDYAKKQVGVFALNDIVALTVIDVITDIGYHIPEEYCVVGFDNTYLSRVHRPSLSSVAQPISELGHRAVDILSQRIENPTKKIEHITLHSRLVLRQSSSLEVKA
ncbi:MAG: LacI family DNA-binding transcriptional regulator [Spirochaetia bacterium]